MAVLETLLVLAILALFGLIVFWMFWTERKKRRDRKQIAEDLGFNPLNELDDSTYRESRELGKLLQNKSPEWIWKNRMRLVAESLYIRDL